MRCFCKILRISYKDHYWGHEAKTLHEFCRLKWNFQKYIYFHFTCPLTVVVVGAPQVTSQPVSSIFRRSQLGPGELQACPFPDVVFPHFFPSALSSLPPPLHCVLQNGFGQTWWTGDMSIPLRSAFLYDGQEVFVFSKCRLDLGTDFLIGNMAFEWDA